MESKLWISTLVLLLLIMQMAFFPLACVKGGGIPKRERIPFFFSLGRGREGGPSSLGKAGGISEIFEPLLFYSRITLRKDTGFILCIRRARKSSAKDSSIQYRYIVIIFFTCLNFLPVFSFS